MSRVVILHSSLLESTSKASACLSLKGLEQSFSNQEIDKMCKKAGNKCVGYLQTSFNAAAAKTEVAC